VSAAIYVNLAGGTPAATIASLNRVNREPILPDGRPGSFCLNPGMTKTPSGLNSLWFTSL
jgi:hypothetical protein